MNFPSVLRIERGHQPLAVFCAHRCGYSVEYAQFDNVVCVGLLGMSTPNNNHVQSNGKQGAIKRAPGQPAHRPIARTKKIHRLRYASAFPPAAMMRRASAGEAISRPNSLAILTILSTSSALLRAYCPGPTKGLSSIPTRTWPPNEIAMVSTL